MRGRVLRSDDEDGSRARLLKNSIFALKLSASGSFPASSDDNRARAGTLTSALMYEPGAYGIFIGSSMTFHDGAANESSPLFRERMNYAGFVGFRWYFFKSNSLGYL